MSGAQGDHENGLPRVTALLPHVTAPLPPCHALFPYATPPSPLQVLERMPDKPGLDLDQQPSWSELAVLVRMLLYLSFQDRLDGEPAHL